MLSLFIREFAMPDNPVAAWATVVAGTQPNVDHVLAPFARAKPTFFSACQVAYIVIQTLGATLIAGAINFGSALWPAERRPYSPARYEGAWIRQQPGDVSAPPHPPTHALACLQFTFPSTRPGARATCCFGCPRGTWRATWP